MPFGTEVRESTKLMQLNTWLCQQIKEAPSHSQDQYPTWPKEKIEGYIQGRSDMALDCISEVKRLKQC